LKNILETDSCCLLTSKATWQLYARCSVGSNAILSRSEISARPLSCVKLYRLTPKIF
jgi:hypothetical protein